MIENTFRQSRPAEGPRNVQFKISLTRNEVDLLEDASIQLHISKSEMIRIAIADYLDHQE